ncbi:hypothetical protein [Phaeobacter gallaeciensis]|uniref:Uncharacterized protein n=1 Tax=Phaeobacter gallaeciensis TaxID=60890 RepID=A0AAC9Z9L9_9RHOB|nr:hypothetical protein [Phaeobacter gallaeciensis]AHD09789.1 hypothetical protein Gal_02039 [Phaeobacter gallaeciensis DSM 26640]ATE93053.1 hypothetical protein PhaeoP11_02030 [Phaeobacter gallaeciensis]ATE97125.1 hypothetical protein PhaeoP73_01816 [Phaeobacter gallaeciensis]ATF01718.1 hypothetical protein PhaeoP75_02080 [Phaeobacter gallaeciensis]ATF06098.1 hypothetical protein PhaeoP63_02029 [Phaeobacter gallaeciensis]
MCTSSYLFDINGMTVVYKGVLPTGATGVPPCDVSAQLIATKRSSIPAIGPNSQVPLVYLHRDYHADERSPKLLDILGEWHHGGPVHALRISSVTTLRSARIFVEALLAQFPTIVVLEDGAQGGDRRICVLSAEPEVSPQEQQLEPAPLTARLPLLGTLSP